MKTTSQSVFALVLTMLLGGCSQKSASQSAEEDAAAKARADALKKEMQTAPKVFSNRDMFKKNEPAKQSDAKAVPTQEK